MASDLFISAVVMETQWENTELVGVNSATYGNLLEPGFFLPELTPTSIA